jgi:hypothetical protein
MTSENNERFLKWLDLEADGCLGEAERAELKAAMAVDPELRRVQQELQGLHQALASDRIEVAPGFLERVMAALPAAPWRRSSRRSWGLAAAAVAVLTLGSSLLVGLSGGATSAGPVLGIFGAIGKMLQASVVTGAGLLGASWLGVGLALGEVLTVSPVTMVAFGVVVLGVNLLFFRLLRRRVGAAQLVENGSSDSSSR